MKFRATVQLNGKTATGIPVPPELVAGLGAGKKPPVQVTVNGHTYRSSIATMGGQYLISLSAENRAKAGVAAGDEIEVELALDTAPREVSAPADLAEALDSDREAKRFFESLSYSNRRRVVEPIEGAKAAETRKRRIAKAVETLHAGKVP
ncbi:MAG TPA: YdeI/OmpD-associated family protein [Amycolatopsis sp.]|uniref:YdeI/OmpD-associated family protein n=1 Tax=Amycolatopsis sp. TaxID=37632 RepID=UPI002B499E6B|nr:YdeI/OmpD-associated family protein [Amycolatopsis sp.]HKS47269.1 YdeI/OmpD-associated family protein [Amycolatopsis sp.]